MIIKQYLLILYYFYRNKVILPIKVYIIYKFINPTL